MFNRHILLISLIALIVLVISVGSAVVAAPLGPPPDKDKDKDAEFEGNVIVGGDIIVDGTVDGVDVSTVKPQNVVVVSPSGGDFTSIQAALTDITNTGAPSLTNRYLVKVGPGVYTEQTIMIPFVDIEGSGELTTKITFVGNTSTSTGFTVKGASNAELRFLTVENTGGALLGIAIFNNSASPRLTNVTATASGGSRNTGVSNNSSSPTMNNVTATALGGGINTGVFNNSSSPTMNNVTATASGGTRNAGVENVASSSPTMNNVTATASGGASTTGVFNDSSSPTMNNVTATASGGVITTGVFNDSSSPTMNNVTATASGGSLNTGVENFAIVGGGFTVTIEHSRLTGSDNSIKNDSGFTTRVGASQLVGGSVQVVGGTVTCVFSYNESFVALNSSCT